MLMFVFVPSAKSLFSWSVIVGARKSRSVSMMSCCFIVLQVLLVFVCSVCVLS